MTMWLGKGADEMGGMGIWMLPGHKNIFLSLPEKFS
jgi:hypothetical protein